MSSRLNRALTPWIAAALLLAGCTKEEAAPCPAAENHGRSMSVGVAFDTATRAAGDNDGSGIYANQCRLQIYSADTLYYDRTVEVVNFRATFNDVIMYPGNIYDFLFWADNREGGYYNTGDLRCVSLAKDYQGNDDKRDAFFASALGKGIEQMCDTTVILKRPFAQLNVITKDIPALYSQFPDKGELAAQLPDSVKIKVSKVATIFNVMSGIAGEYRDVESTMPVYTQSWKYGTGDSNTLSMDYFFAADAKDGELSKIDYTLFNNGSGMKPVDYHFDNIPLKRNWRTNISGNLLTVSGKISIEVNPLWDGETNCR